MKNKFVSMVAMCTLMVGALGVGTGGQVAHAATTCGWANSSYKYSTSVLGFTIDVFNHANRTDACKSSTKITSIWKGKNDCTKYAWGILYGGGSKYEFSPVNQPVADGLATCWKQVGGTFKGIGISYKKQSNTKHRFSISGSTLMVAKSHWTTTP